MGVNGEWCFSEHKQISAQQELLISPGFRKGSSDKATFEKSYSGLWLQPSCQVPARTDSRSTLVVTLHGYPATATNACRASRKNRPLCAVRQEPSGSSTPRTERQIGPYCKTLPLQRQNFQERPEVGSNYSL